MLKTIVTVLGAVGWLGALALVWALRDTPAPQRLALDPDAPMLQRLGAVAARGAGALVGSLVAGILVMGLGGRLMMRVLAATSTDEVQGAITDMEAVVGEVTFEGTFFFVLFVGAGAGVIGWLLRLAVRQWLPNRSILAGLIGAGIGAGLLAQGSGLVDPHNIDFALLSPTWLAMVLNLGLIVSFGMLLVALADRFAARWPTPTRPIGLVWLSPLLMVLPLIPMAVAAAAVGLVRAAAVPIDRWAWLGWLDRFAPRAVLAAAAAGAVVTLANAFRILTA